MIDKFYFRTTAQNFTPVKIGVTNSLTKEVLGYSLTNLPVGLQNNHFDIGKLIGRRVALCFLSKKYYKKVIRKANAKNIN